MNSLIEAVAESLTILNKNYGGATRGCHGLMLGDEVIKVFKEILS